MAQLAADRTGVSAPAGWRHGVGARLLLAFLGIAAFAVLAATAGIYASRLVGDRIERVDELATPTLTSLELSRSAERIIAAAPALLAATDRQGKDAVNAELQRETASLNDRLAELKADVSNALPLEQIEPIVASLTSNLAALDKLVARRLETRERLGTLRHRLFETNDAVRRLLAPWLEVIDGQIALLIQGGDDTRSGIAANDRRLESSIELQRLTETAQRQASAIVDMLVDASTVEEALRLPILTFQLRLAFDEIETTAAGLEPKLRPLFAEQVESLWQLADGPGAIPAARERELELVGEAEGRLAEIANLSSRLTTAVDQLGGAAKIEIGNAIGDALSVQRLSNRTLIVLAGLSLITSILIVWLYVGGNIVRRLTALSDEALAVAGGRLDTPIQADGSDEIAAMGRAVEIFRQNAIALDRLLEERKAAAAKLETVVEERTRDLQEKSRQLEEANLYKSRFLAAASHDLRQPLHALNLFVAQLDGGSGGRRQDQVVAGIDAAIDSMNDLFGALLDMSKLEGGLLEPDLGAFPIQRLLARIESTFANAASEKALRLTVVPSSAWVRSDAVLLERILQNLVSNAIRHTQRGGVVVGCRHRDRHLRIDVCDSGPGVPEAQRVKIFDEFYQIHDAGRDRRGGLGLGLSIVDRLARLLGYPIELASHVGRGSRFSVSVPLAAPITETSHEPSTNPAVVDTLQDKLVVVIDDDPLVLEGMRGALQSWGCRVVTAPSDAVALEALIATEGRPDLIVSDLRLAGGRSGIDAIACLRARFGEATPAFLISGDTMPERMVNARESGFHLLHKPVSPIQLRAMMNHVLISRRVEAAGLDALG